MSSVTRTAGVEGTFHYSLNQEPDEAPVLTIYSDAERTTVAVAAATLTATANPAVFVATYPAALAAGTYYLSFSTVLTTGQPAVVDQDDTLVLAAVVGSVDTSYATVAEARAFGISTAEANDDQLTSWLETASRVVDEYTGTSFGVSAPTSRTYRGLRANRLSLPYPSDDILSVTVDGTALSTDSYTVDDFGISVRSHLTGRSVVVVTGTFGFTTVPAVVREATLFIARNLIRASSMRPTAGTDTEGNPTTLPTAGFVPLAPTLGEDSTGSVNADRLLRSYRYTVPVG